MASEPAHASDDIESKSSAHDSDSGPTDEPGRGSGSNRDISRQGSNISAQLHAVQAMPGYEGFMKNQQSLLLFEFTQVNFTTDVFRAKCPPPTKMTLRRRTRARCRVACFSVCILCAYESRLCMWCARSECHQRSDTYAARSCSTSAGSSSWTLGI